MPGKIGLIAGNGAFPILFAKEARNRGDRVIAVALKEEADPALEKSVDQMTWLSLGQLGKTIDYLKENGVDRAVMAGQVKHTQLFKDIIPDWRAAKLLGRLINKKAESVLLAVTEEFAKDGIRFLSSATYLESWLCPAGILTTRKLSSVEQADIDFGVPLAQTMAGQDIGLTVVVKDGTVVAVEAMEGTDACIKRAGKIAGPGCVAIKVARPNQDLRFDLPVVGQRTLDALKEAGISVLAMQSAKTLLLDKDNLIRSANDTHITLTGLSL